MRSSLRALLLFAWCAGLAAADAAAQQTTLPAPVAKALAHAGIPESAAAVYGGCHLFEIRDGGCAQRPTVRISPDLPVCAECLEELFDSSDRRYRYPYINCTNCGPRYTVVLCLPYDRPSTTMKHWVLDDYCDAEYQAPRNRVFTGSRLPARSADRAITFTLAMGPRTEAKRASANRPSAAATR